jgi:hypothetical protein
MNWFRAIGFSMLASGIMVGANSSTNIQEWASAILIAISAMLLGNKCSLD